MVEGSGFRAEASGGLCQEGPTLLLLDGVVDLKGHGFR